MKSYEIRYGGLLPGVKDVTTQCACYFEIMPKNPPGSEFCFDVSLSRLDFCALVTRPELGLTMEDAEWVLLKYGLEKTKRELNEGIECDGHEIGLGQGDFPSRPEVSESDKEELQKFEQKRKVIQYNVKKSR